MQLPSFGFKYFTFSWWKGYHSVYIVQTNSCIVTGSRTLGKTKNDENLELPIIPFGGFVLASFWSLFQLASYTGREKKGKNVHEQKKERWKEL